jgi:hypothetical protein
MRILLRTLYGGLVGGVLAILATIGLTALCVQLSPNDPSAGSVGIMIIGTLPLGVFAGLVHGFIKGKKARGTERAS